MRARVSRWSLGLIILVGKPVIILALLGALGGCGGGGDDGGGGEGLSPSPPPPSPSANRAPQASPITLQAGTLPYIEQRLIGTDPDNDTLTFELQGPSSGTGYTNAYLNPTSGRLFVTLVPGFSGTIPLSYRVTDGRQFSPAADVQIQVPPAPASDNLLGSLPVDPRMYSSFDINYLASAVLGTPQAAPSRPARIDLSADFPVPGNQGNQGSCVGWATAYALKSYQEKLEIGWALNTTEHLFSPAFIFNQIFQVDDRGRVLGALISDALNLIRDRGAATWAAMPYSESDFRTQPSPSTFQDATRYRGRQWYRVDGVSGVKDALSNRRAVVLGIDVYPTFQMLRGANSVYNTISGASQGGHAVTVVGYDDSRFGGAFRIINSWRTTWGDGGYFWLPYNFFPTVVNEAYVLEDAENSSPPPPSDPTQPPPTGNLPDLQVQSWQVVGFDPRPGGRGRLEYRVVNAGQGIARRGADVNLMLSSNPTITSSDTYVVWEEIPFDLASGETVFRDSTNQIQFTLPENLQPGTYHMTLWVDDLGEVDESNETNNISLSAGMVTIENTRPDLVVSSWFASWDTTSGNGTLVYRVLNQGRSLVNSTDWDINLVLSPDENIGNGNEIFLFFEDARSNLAPGGAVFRDDSNPARFNIFRDQQGSAVPEGNYFMALWVDDQRQVDESNERNNSSLGADIIVISRGGGVRSLSQRVAEHEEEIQLHEEETRTSTAYNGKRLPPPQTPVRQVAIRRTPQGGFILEFVDERQPAPTEASVEDETLSKQMQSADAVIFPIVQEIPMPEVPIIPSK